VSTSEPTARLLSYGFALSPGRPVGRLVDVAEPPQTTVTAPGGLPAPARASVHAAAQGWAGRSHEAGVLLPVTLWIGFAVIVLAVLGALVARQRRR
jgi:hypothetical protein